MIVDKLFQELQIGDSVVFNPPKYKGIKIGRVIKLTPKGITIRYGNEECNRFSNDVIKIDEQINIAKDKYPESYL